jgi:hypothetical protein
MHCENLVFVFFYQKEMPVGHDVYGLVLQNRIPAVFSDQIDLLGSNDGGCSAKI